MVIVIQQKNGLNATGLNIKNGKRDQFYHNFKKLPLTSRYPIEEALESSSPQPSNESRAVFVYGQVMCSRMSR